MTSMNWGGWLCQAAKPCPHCDGPHGASFCLKADFEAIERRAQTFRERAAAHSLASAVCRAAQRFQNGVTDLDVAIVFYAIEADGMMPRRLRSGRWVSGPHGRIPTRHDLSAVVNEMIRTGLLRHVVECDEDYLVPALVHLLDGSRSACLFTGEDLGPMRSRLVSDLTLVDCLECEAAVARGGPRGL